MTTPAPIGDLENPKDLKFQKRWWTLQRAGWLLMGCFLIVSVSGGLGEGGPMMEAMLRALVVYVFLLIVFRMAGKRTLNTLTMFDFVLVLIISEAIQDVISPKDAPPMSAFIVVTTLVSLDICLSFLKQWFPTVDRVVDDLPLVILTDGKPISERMKKERIDEADILSAARINHGLTGLHEIKIAVLERDGEISVIPK